MKNRLALAIGEFPARALEWPLWLVQFFVGIYLLTPYYTPVPDGAGSNASVAAALGSTIALKIYAFILFSVGVLGLAGLIFDTRRYSAKLRGIASFTSFIIFIYFVILRLLIFGPNNLLWVTYFLNACMAAAIYLRLQWEKT